MKNQGPRRGGKVAASPLVWPTTLVPPARPPKLVYLDLNHWIYLSQAAAGGGKGAAFEGALACCREAKAAGDAVFVLSAAHYMELTKIRDPAQRRRIADVMEDLSSFTTLLDRQIVVRMEIESMLDYRFGGASSAYLPVNLLGHGMGHAFGMKGGFHVASTTTGKDASDDLRARIGDEEFESLIRTVNLEGERMLLRGPEDSEIPELLKLGYRADVAEQGARQRAKQEAEQRERHRGTPWGAGQKLADVVLAREAALELLELLYPALKRRGVHEIADLFSSRDAAREVISSMPTSYVSALLKTEQHRNLSKAWVSNDIFDIDSMSLAVPYCDIVVTEKYRWHDLRKANLEVRMNTVILRTLKELEAYL